MIRTLAILAICAAMLASTGAWRLIRSAIAAPGHLSNIAAGAVRP